MKLADISKYAHNGIVCRSDDKACYVATQYFTTDRSSPSFPEA